MFHSVIEQQGLRAGRFGIGATVSVLVHAGVFAAALFLSTGAVEEKEDPRQYIVHLVQPPPPPQPPKGSPTPPKPKPVAERPKPKPKIDKLVQPKEIPPPLPEEAPPAPEPVEPPEEDLPYVEGGDRDGVDTGGVIGAIAIPGLPGGPEGPSMATGVDVLPFGSGMTPPQLMSSRPLQYTREALEARVRGLMIVRCTITVEGEVRNCKVIKGLAHMNEATVASLESRRYRPVYYQGRPVAVSYTFNVKLELPH